MIADEIVNEGYVEAGRIRADGVFTALPQCGWKRIQFSFFHCYASCSVIDLAADERSYDLRSSAFICGLLKLSNGSRYSFRSAVVGSNPAARSAGSHEAITAINKNSTATDANVTGSVGLTSTSMLASTRVIKNAATSPIAIPIALR